MSERYTKAKAIEMVQDVFGMRQEWLNAFQSLDTIKELIFYKCLNIRREIDLHSVLMRDFGVDEGSQDLAVVLQSLEEVLLFVESETARLER